MQHRVVAVVAATAFVLVSCDDGLPELDTEPAAARLQTITEENGSTALDACPVGTITPILDDVFELVDDDIIRRVLSGTPSSRSDLSTPDSGPVVACELVTGDGTAGILVLDAPDDLTTFTEATLGLPLDGVTVDVDESRLFRGGQFHHVCIDDAADPEAASCAVDWIDEHLMVGVFVAGDGAYEVDIDRVEERFQYLLPTIIDRLSTP